MVADAQDTCGNGCKFCYMKKYENMVANVPMDLGEIKEQLTIKNPVKTYLDKYKVVRIGALGDIKIGDSKSYNDVLELMQLLHVNNYNYILVTKSCHSVTDFMLELMKSHNAILNVSCGFYSLNASKRFESSHIVPPEGRRRLIEKSIRKGIPTVLRLNPMHPDFLSEHVKVIEWFASVGGERIILETLRLLGTWKSQMPDVDFSKFVGAKDGGVYNGYITPPREMQDSIMSSMIYAAQTNGINKVTICGDMELNDRIGYRKDDMDCCHISEILGTERPPRDWDDLDIVSNNEYIEVEKNIKKQSIIKEKKGQVL